jgi:hypothetical protein
MLDEYYALGKFIGTSYSDYLTMPTYVRKYLINKLIEVNTPPDNK